MIAAKGIWLQQKRQPLPWTVCIPPKRLDDRKRRYEVFTWLKWGYVSIKAAGSQCPDLIINFHSSVARTSQTAFSYPVSIMSCQPFLISILSISEAWEPGCLPRAFGGCIWVFLACVNMPLLLSLPVSSRLKAICSEIVSPFCWIDTCLVKSLRKAATNAVYEGAGVTEHYRCLFNLGIHGKTVMICFVPEGLERIMLPVYCLYVRCVSKET